MWTLFFCFMSFCFGYIIASIIISGKIADLEKEVDSLRFRYHTLRRRKFG